MKDLEVSRERGNAEQANSRDTSDSLQELTQLLQGVQTILDQSSQDGNAHKPDTQQLLDQVEAFLQRQRLLARRDLESRSILPLDTEGILRLRAHNFMGKRTLVLGQSGAGKSNAEAVIIEGLLAEGLPMTIIDPEGEAWSLKELSKNILVVGKSPHADREYTPDQMAMLAELSVTEGFTVILDLDGYLDEEVYALLIPYLDSLWLTCSRLRRAYHLVVDEIQDLVPQIGKTPVKSRLIRIAKKGRKRGLGMLCASQQTTSVDNALLTQTDIRFLFTVSYPSDIERYKTLIPRLSTEEIEQRVPGLSPGEGYVIYKHRPFLIKMLRRRSFDPSETPTLGARVHEPALEPVDATMLAAIDAKLTDVATTDPEREDHATLVQHIRTLEQQLHALQVEKKTVRSSGTALSAGPKPRSLEAMPSRIREMEAALLTGERRWVELETEKTEQEAEKAQLRSDLESRKGRIRELEGQVELLGKISVSLDGAIMPVTSLPAALHLDTLHTHAGHATITVEQVARGIREEQAKAVPSSTVANGDGKEPAQQKFLYSEQQLLSRLIGQIRALSPAEKALFIYLLEHPGRSFRSGELAEAVGMSSSVTRSDRTPNLRKIPFIKRNETKASWSAPLSDYYQRHFRTGIDTGLMTQQLIKAARS